MHRRSFQPSLRGDSERFQGSSLWRFFTTFPVAHKARTRYTR